MSDCGQYGFAYVDSKAVSSKSEKPRFRVWYFEEFRGPWIQGASDTRGADGDVSAYGHNYEKIIKCLREGEGKTVGIAGCTHLATAWLDLELGKGSEARVAASAPDDAITDARKVSDVGAVRQRMRRSNAKDNLDEIAASTADNHSPEQVLYT